MTFFNDRKVSIETRGVGFAFGVWNHGCQIDGFTSANVDWRHYTARIAWVHLNGPHPGLRVQSRYHLRTRGVVTDVTIVYLEGLTCPALDIAIKYAERGCVHRLSMSRADFYCYWSVR